MRAAIPPWLNATGVCVMGQAEKIFRQHDVAPAVTSSALYRQLTVDWAHTHARPTTPASVRRWGRTEPQLEGFARPGDVVDAIDDAGHHRKDALLLALLRLVQAGDPLAGQTLLHAMLPGLAGLASRTAPKLSPSEPDRAEAARQLVVEEFWETAAQYPILRRRHRVASNLLLDSLKRVTRHLRQSDPIPCDPTALHVDVDPGAGWSVYPRPHDLTHGHDRPGLVDGVNPDSDLLTVLAWAVQSRVISADEAQMLADVYLSAATDGWAFDDVSEALGTSRAAVKMRCSRAVARLTAAVRTDLSDNANVS